MTTPTNENRDTDRADSEPRPRLDLSVTKIAAGATAAALSAAVGSKLGVAGTIVGAAVASVVATSAGAVIGHSLERGKTAARKAMPVLDPENLETALLTRARLARPERAPDEAADEAVDQTRVDQPMALTRVGEAPLKHSLADWALAASTVDETAVLDGKTHAAAGPYPESTVPAEVTADEPDPTGVSGSGADTSRSWKDRLPGRKPLMAAAIASFVLGTGAVTALEVARKGEFPGYHSNVFTGPEQNGGSHQSPDPEYPGGGTHKGSTPSQKPDSSATSGSGSGSSSPSSVPSTPSPSGSTSPSGSSTPSTSSSGGATTPSTTPSTPPTGSTGPTTAPSSSGGGATPSGPSATGGAPKATPTGGTTSGQ